MNPSATRKALSGHLRRASVYIGMLLIVAVFVFPFYWLAISAFKTREQLFTMPPQFFPSPVVFENFVNVFSTTPLARAFLNSCIIAGGHVALALFLCSLGGYAFAKFRNAPGRNLLFAFALGTMMIPAAVTMIPVFIVLARLNLVNTWWAMIIPGAANAFGIFWMRQYIEQHVPDDLLAAGRIDGCGEFGLYRMIVLPVCKPALAALGILLLISSWNNLMWAFVVLRTQQRYTMPLLIYLLQGEMRTPYGMVMAGGLLATLPLVVAFLVFQRAFISGMTAGAIKG